MVVVLKGFDVPNEIPDIKLIQTIEPNFVNDEAGCIEFIKNIMKGKTLKSDDHNKNPVINTTEPVYKKADPILDFIYQKRTRERRQKQTLQHKRRDNSFDQPQASSPLDIFLNQVAPMREQMHNDKRALNNYQEECPFTTADRMSMNILLDKMKRADKNKKMKIAGDITSMMKARISVNKSDEAWKQYNKARELLSKFKLNPSISQFKIIDMIFIASLPLILGDALWGETRMQFFRKFKITLIPTLVGTLMPRRYGKSIAITMVLAILMTLCISIKIVIFSQKLDISKDLLVQSKKNYEELGNTLPLKGTNARTINRQEQLIVLGRDQTGLNSMLVKAADSDRKY